MSPELWTWLRRSVSLRPAAVLLVGVVTAALFAATASPAPMPASTSPRSSTARVVPGASTRAQDWSKSYGKCSQIGWSGSGGSLNAGSHLWTKICHSDATWPFVFADCTVLGASVGGPVGALVGAVVCTPIANWAVDRVVH